MKKFHFILVTIMLIMSIFACRKYKQNTCIGQKETKADFKILHLSEDTTFETDTMFKHSYVRYSSNFEYDSVFWQIGLDSRIWKTKTVTLPMFNASGTLEVNFRAKAKPNTTCFPNDSGIYIGKKAITFFEGINKNASDFIVSPLKGKFRGVTSNNPLDTFIVSIDYFDSAKYDVSRYGAKNFYWMSNFPKGYVSTASYIVLNPNTYPELKNGFQIPYSYNNIRIEQYFESRFLTTGWLENGNNTLVLMNRNVNNSPPFYNYKFVGKRIQ